MRFVLHTRNDGVQRAPSFPCGETRTYESAFPQNPLDEPFLYLNRTQSNIRTMGFEPFADQAAEFRKCASALRRVDQLNEGNQTHRIDRMEPLAAALDEIGKSLEEGLLQRAKSQAYVLLVAVDKAATLNIGFVERSELARALGRIKTKAKSEAARENGRSGGRPRKDGQLPRRKRMNADDMKTSTPI